MTQEELAAKIADKRAEIEAAVPEVKEWSNKEWRHKDGTKPITPVSLAREMVACADNDPGTEFKCMVFEVKLKDGRTMFVGYKGCRSEARVFVLEMIEREVVQL